MLSVLKILYRTTWKKQIWLSVTQVRSWPEANPVDQGTTVTWNCFDCVMYFQGAGSCLEALGAQKALLVVINDKLMDNHQLELARQLHSDSHLLYCTCRSVAVFNEQAGGADVLLYCFWWHLLFCATCPGLSNLLTVLHQSLSSCLLSWVPVPYHFPCVPKLTLTVGAVGTRLAWHWSVVVTVDTSTKISVHFEFDVSYPGTRHPLWSQKSGLFSYSAQLLLTYFH